jgi:hypothetical protein
MLVSSSLTIKTAPKTAERCFREALLRQTEILITENYFAGRPTGN